MKLWLMKRGKAEVRLAHSRKKRAAVAAAAILFLAMEFFAGSCTTVKNSGKPAASDTAGSGQTESAQTESAQKQTDIDPLGFVNAEMKNNTDLVRWAKLALQDRWGYVLGTFGQVLDEPLLDYKLEQYAADVSPEENFIRSHWIGGRAADCVGLIKGYVWYNADTGGIDYGAYGLPDVDAGGMFRLAAVKGPISTMPDVPGLAVYIQGKHIGIYVGGGKVIHAMDTEHGVVESELSRGSWTHWLQVPGVEYDAQ